MKNEEVKHKKEDIIKYKKNMIFNAIEEGWKVEKKNGYLKRNTKINRKFLQMII